MPYTQDSKPWESAQPGRRLLPETRGPGTQNRHIRCHHFPFPRRSGALPPRAGRRASMGVGGTPGSLPPHPPCLPGQPPGLEEPFGQGAALVPAPTPPPPAPLAALSHLCPLFWLCRGQRGRGEDGARRGRRLPSGNGPLSLLYKHQLFRASSSVKAKL